VIITRKLILPDPDRLVAVAVTSPRGTITLLSRLSKSVYRKCPESLLGMSLRHYLALSYIADPGGISQQQLSEILCIDANNTVLLLNEMEGQGLIRRVRDPADRRRHLVEVTEHGEEVFHRAQHQRETVEDEVLGVLTADERATLHRLLAKALGD
jgi:DNA-binding MarR family transcriptional regulator